MDKLKLFVLMVLSSLKNFGNLIKKHIWRSPVIVKLQLDAYNFTKKDFFFRYIMVNNFWEELFFRIIVKICFRAGCLNMFQNYGSLVNWSCFDAFFVNPLSTNSTKCSNTLKQFVGKSRRNFWVCDHFVGLALKGLIRTHLSQNVSD